MKRVASFTLFLLCVACFGVSAVIVVFAWHEPVHSSPLPPLPTLVADPQVIDFGKISAGRVGGNAVLTNVSQKPLRILHVFVSYSCSDVQLQEGIVPPGGSVNLSVVWNTHGRSGKTKTSLSIIYLPDGAEQRQQRLTVVLRADVADTTEGAEDLPRV